MHEPEVLPVAITALVLDPKVQRPLDKRRVTKLAEGLNLDALGLITVSHRSNGDHAILDGQHRVEALKEAGYGNGKVLCRVFSGLTLAEEAAMFRLLNNTKKPMFVDVFRVRVIEGEPVAVEIERLLTSNGWRIDAFGNANSFRALAALERVYRVQTVAAERTLATITRAWGHDPNGGDGRVVEGIGLVHLRYGDAIEHDDLIERLSKMGGGPGALLGKARGLRDLIGSTVPRAVAEIVVELYNQRRRTKALPPWRSS